MQNNLLAEFGWSGILSVVIAILVLLLMITVHEFGHYLAGKIFHFKINEFSIGFGPAIFKRKSKKTGEVFSLRLIPLGGYCAFADEEGLEENTENDGVERVFLDEEVTPADKMPTSPTEKKRRPDWKKREKSGKFCDMHPLKRLVVLVAGATMNYLLALIFIFCSFGFFGQLLPGVVAVEQTESIAQEYCMQNGDVILGVNGKDVYTTSDIMSALQNKKEGERVPFKLSRIVDVANDKAVRKEVNVKIELRRATDFKNSADFDKLWQALGVAKQTDSNGNVIVSESGSVSYMVASFRCPLSFFETLGRGTVYSVRIAGSIFKVLGELLTGALGLNAMGGPVTTISTTSQLVSRGVQPFLEITAYIGVNLAVFNLLPIPALDGSKVIFTAIEWVRGKPINRKIEAAIHTIGIMLLFGFAILVDLLQLI